MPQITTREPERQQIEEAREFLEMMRCAYSEIWRRRFMGEPAITPASVLAIFEDCEFHRTRLTCILSKSTRENWDIFVRDKLHVAYEIHQHLDASWRSLYTASIGKIPKYTPQKM